MKHPEVQEATALIETCAEMCRTKGVNFAEVLQDPVFEGHRVLYWIIISRPPRDQYGLMSTILNYSGSLSSEATDEVRLACIQVGHPELFNHLWRHPAYGALSRTDKLLLGSTSPVDCVREIKTYFHAPETFAVSFDIAQFHKRMSVSGRIVFEFIALGLSPC